MEFIVINFQTWKVIESLGKAVRFSENKKAKKRKIKSNRSSETAFIHKHEFYALLCWKIR